MRAKDITDTMDGAFHGIKYNMYTQNQEDTVEFSQTHNEENWAWKT